MNIILLKEKLDSLYSKINPPYGIIPQWYRTAAMEKEILDAEIRLKTNLPVQVKEVFKVFSGITHDTPYFMGERFHEIEESLSKIGYPNEDDEGLKDDLVISQIESIGNWGVVDETYDAKHEYITLIDDLKKSDVEGEAIFVDCPEDLIRSDGFIFIGDSYSESIFININKNHKDFGCIYNLRPFYPNFIAYKIADGYFDFMLNIEKSLLFSIST